MYSLLILLAPQSGLHKMHIIMHDKYHLTCIAGWSAVRNNSSGNKLGEGYLKSVHYDDKVQSSDSMKLLFYYHEVLLTGMIK